ncbi:tetratricopeptide repeat protein [Polycladidibacter hongkongensis]|uniref:tetratricopeptide repeat protein n=1 Tax=Polycladidibacter hongkongensis TaxID=1647556 RepID=UPI00082EC16F|nr:tetratricopeptide repeat protein [Pseudovibrio hongkongensis]
MKRLSLAIAVIIGLTTRAMAEWEDEATQEKNELFTQATELIKAERYDDALKVLETAGALEPPDADTLNLLGFTYRKLGEYGKAGELYNKALQLQPTHMGALEYQGELFLLLGDLSAAEENLKKLKKLCPAGCKERSKLEQTIRATNYVK